MRTTKSWANEIEINELITDRSFNSVLYRLKMRYLDPLLFIKSPDRNVFQIILWWETRRILYNIIVLVAGIVSIIVMSIAALGRLDLEPGEDLYEPIMIPVFAVLCNMGYTLGWLTEIFLKRNVIYGPKMFKIGLYFTIFWVFLPSAIWVVIACVDVIKRIF